MNRNNNIINESKQNKYNYALLDVNKVYTSKTLKVKRKVKAERSIVEFHSITTLSHGPTTW